MNEKIVTIERLVFGGKGLTRDLEKITFIPLTLPGEKVRVRVTKERGDYQEAEAIEIIEPHPLRVAPQCPYFGVCGGCQLSHASYEEQIRLKTEILKETLNRNKVTYPSVEVLAAQPFAYRHRAQLKYDAAQKKLGFYELNSNRVVDIRECLCLTPGLNVALQSLRIKVCSQSIHGLREVECYENDKGETAIFPNLPLPDFATTDPMELTISFRQNRFPMNPKIFLQVNPGMWKAMVQEVESHFDKCGDQTLLELYCGAGFFTAPLSNRFRRIVACEENADAIDYARTNHRLQNVEWRCTKVESYRFPRDIHAVLVDPPRSGLHTAVVNQLLERKPSLLTYVSCDCTTFARDIKKLQQIYKMKKLTMLDLFPQTYHFEMIALLEAK